MAAIRGMMAVSLDGYAADPGGGVDFLNDFGEVEWGYADFIAQIGTVVLGRRTWEHMWHLTDEWPYPGKPGIVVGQGLTPPLRDGAIVWTGDLTALAATLRAEPQDAWVVGGPMLQNALLAMGVLDRLELCIVPRLLGRGVAVFPAGATPPRQPRLQSARSLPMGMVMLDYTFGD